jgi:uncharacterized protein (DUF1697 family)
MRYVALLRGINVGKSLQVPMKRLAALLGELGHTEVATYLNSGNAVFSSERGRDEVAAGLEAALAAEFGRAVPTLVKTAAEMAAIRAAVPDAWANDPTQQSYVAYLFPDADRPTLVDELPIKRQYLDIRYVSGAILWNIARANYNKSRITAIAGHPAYARMTTRNVNTARKLAELARG